MLKKLMLPILISLTLYVAMVNSLGNSSQQHFLEWMSKNQKQYTHEEFVYRYEVYRKNVEMVEMHN
jgi:hypothetical protein